MLNSDICYCFPMTFFWKARFYLGTKSLEKVAKVANDMFSHPPTTPTPSASSTLSPSNINRQSPETSAQSFFAVSTSRVLIGPRNPEFSFKSRVCQFVIFHRVKHGALDFCFSGLSSFSLAGRWDNCKREKGHSEIANRHQKESPRL